MLDFKMIHPKANIDMLGFIPLMLDEADPHPAREQLNEAYSHGGGWRPFQGFKLLPSGEIQYPEDPPLKLLAEGKLRDETIRFYDCAWVMILQPDGSFEICRMD